NYFDIFLYLLQKIMRGVIVLIAYLIIAKICGTASTNNRGTNNRGRNNRGTNNRGTNNRGTNNRGTNNRSTNSRGTFNNVGYSTKYYHKIGYMYEQSPIATSVMSMAAYDMEIAAVQCLSTCQKEANLGTKSCIAVNFNTRNGTCQLLSKQPLYKYDTKVKSRALWTLYTEEPIKYPRDCEDIEQKDIIKYYKIQPDTSKPPFSVLCSKHDLYRTYIQYHDRLSSFDFQKGTWDQYQNGFKDDHTSGRKVYYWIGNENLHTLTHSRNYSVRFGCENSNVRSGCEKTKLKRIHYSGFLVDSKQNYYQLTIGSVIKNDDDMDDAIINGSRFLTHENHTEDACASQGGWWYKNCTNANFNTANENMFWGGMKCSISRIRVQLVKDDHMFLNV
ncbi:unnamed protein product, partial [Owenia fusiformis]